MTIKEDEALTLLKAIDYGMIKLLPELESDGVNRVWVTENGWRITIQCCRSIFDDAGDWDYIDNIVAPDGRSLKFSIIYTMPHLLEWSPTDYAFKKIWKW